MAQWDEDDYGSMANKSCWLMFAILTVIIALRIVARLRYCRGGLVGGLGVDDFITIFCWIIFLVTCVLITIGSSYGLGRHMSTLAPEQIPQALKYNVVISSVLIWAFSMPKFAIIAVLKRILDYGTKTTVVFWGLALSSQACIFATSIWWYEQCTPIEHGWDTNVPGTCAAVSIMTNLGYFTSAYSAFLDIVFALYPIPSIMRLNMPLKSRIAVSVALGLSSLACVISIYKLTIFGEIFAMLEVDPTYPVAYLDILGMAEGFILLVCASLPSLGPFVRMIRGKVYSTNGSNSRSEGHNLSSSGQSRGWMSSNHSKSGNLEQPTPKRSSVDEIPLVTPPQDHSSKDIHWEMKVSVWSEDRTSKSNPTTRADSMIYQGS